MIDNNVLKDLVEIHTLSDGHAPACTVIGSTAFIHSRVFVVELPVSEIQLKKKTWPGTSIPKIEAWREWLPAKPQLLKTTTKYDNRDNGRWRYVRLTSTTSEETRDLQADFYDFCQEQLGNPAFMIIAGHRVNGKQPGPVVLQKDNRWVGVVGALLFDGDE